MKLKLKCRVCMWLCCYDNQDSVSLLVSQIPPSPHLAAILGGCKNWKMQNPNQYVINIFKWCSRWRLKVNKDKTKLVHFRKPRIGRTQHNFQYGECMLEIVDRYKYLSIILDEFQKIDKCVQALSGAGGQSPGATVKEFKLLKYVRYTTFKKIYESEVKSIIVTASVVASNSESWVTDSGSLWSGALGWNYYYHRLNRPHVARNEEILANVKPISCWPRFVFVYLNVPL